MFVKNEEAFLSCDWIFGRRVCISQSTTSVSDRLGEKIPGFDRRMVFAFAGNNTPANAWECIGDDVTNALTWDGEIADLPVEFKEAVESLVRFYLNR